MPEFKINDKTGQIGYSTGDGNIIILPRDINSIEKARDFITNATKDAEQGGQPQFGPGVTPEEQETIRKLHGAVSPQNPANRAGQLGAMRQDLKSFAESPAGVAREQERGRQARQEFGEYAKDPKGLATDAGVAAISSILPAGSGILAGNLVRQSVRNPRVLVRAGQRIATGIGSGIGEFANQQLGITPESTGGILLSSLLGTAVGSPGAKTSPPIDRPLDKAKREAVAHGFKESEQKMFDQAKRGFVDSVMGADINARSMMQPIDEVLHKEAGAFAGKLRGPMIAEDNERRKILNTLAQYRDTLNDHVLALIRLSRQPGVPLPGSATGQPINAKGLPTPMRKQIPDIAASEADIPSMTPRQAQPASAYGTPATQANKPQSPAAGAQSTAQLVGIVGTPRYVAAENIVDDIQKIGRLAEDARRVGATDLWDDMKKMQGKLEDLLSGYKASSDKYAKGHGFREVKEITRTSSNPTAEIRNLLESSRKTTFDDAEKALIIKEASRSEGQNIVLRTMLKTELGRQLLKVGIGPDKTQISNAVLQYGSQLVGRAADKAVFGSEDKK